VRFAAVLIESADSRGFEASGFCTVGKDVRTTPIAPGEIPFTAGPVASDHRKPPLSITEIHQAVISRADLR
jgi:hypothetical protein